MTTATRNTMESTTHSRGRRRGWMRAVPAAPGAVTEASILGAYRPDGQVRTPAAGNDTEVPASATSVAQEIPGPIRRHGAATAARSPAAGACAGR
jgi:hypothetical protein